MSSSKDAIRGSLVVLEAVDSARNTRAFLLFIVCAITALVIGGVFVGIAETLVSNGAMAIGGLFSFIGGLAALIVLATGVQAAGKTLMDQIQGRPQLSVRDALVAGVLTLPKLVAIFLIEFAIFIAFMIVLAIVLFVCKIPFLGPLLYTVVFPVASVIGGMLWFSFLFVVNPLAAPAFWEGYSVGGALGALGMNRVALNIGRLLPPIVQQLVLLFVVGIVTFVATTIVFSGAAFVGLLAGGIIGFGGGLGSLYSNIALSVMAGGVSGYLIATFIGVAVLGALAYTFPLLVYLAGICNIFLSLADAHAAPDAPTPREAYVDPAPRAPVSPVAPTAPAAPAAPVAPVPSRAPVTSFETIASSVPVAAVHAHDAAATCNACGALTEPDDAFCGECGADLPRGA